MCMYLCVSMYVCMFKYNVYVCMYVCACLHVQSTVLKLNSLGLMKPLPLSQILTLIWGFLKKKEKKRDFV